MNDKIEVSIGDTLLELIDRVADSRDEKALVLLDKILLELVSTGTVVSANEISFVDLREYIEVLIEALKNNIPLDEARRDSIRSRF